MFKIKNNSFYYLILGVLLTVSLNSFGGRVIEMNQENTHLVLDEAAEKTLPRNFRTYQSPFIRADEKHSKNISRAGLEKIKFIASGQFSEQSIENVLKQYQNEIWVIDLRRESHGFIDGRPISWYAPRNQANTGLTFNQIETLEYNLLHSLKKVITVNEINKKKNGILVEVKTQTFDVNRIETERELVNSLGLHYIRLPVADHHRPNDTIVDDFIKIVRNLPVDTTMYFHCRAGKGRTTTFVVLWDMLLNAKILSFDEIIERQYLLGGAYLDKASYNPEKAWKAEWAKERWAFLTTFYRYAQEADFREVTWSDWLIKNQ